MRRLFCDAESQLGHGDHQEQEDEQKEGKDGKPERAAEQAEEGRDKGGADVRARHLDADDRARVFRAEVVGRGVDDARVDGPAAEPDDHEPGDREGVRRGDEQQRDAAKQDGRPREDHLAVAELIGEESAQKAARRDADVEEGGKLRRLFVGDALHLRKIGARPVHRRGFRRAVGEESDQQKGHAADAQRAA